MANKSISQLDSAVAVSNGDLFETAIPDSGSATGYSSKKHSMAAVADHIANDVVYTGLQTTAQTLVAAINEAAESGGGGTNVVANPVGEPTDTLSTVQIGATIYDIEGSGAAIDYVEIEITSLTNGTIDTSRGGCWYAKYGNVIHLHLSVKDLTPETTTNVFTMPEAFRPPHVSAMGVGIGASRDKRANVSVGAVSGACNLWSESTTALIDFEWTIDAQGGGGAAVETDVTSLITKNSQYTFSNLKYEAKRVGNTIFMVAESNVDNAPSVGTGFKAFDIDASIRPSTAHANWCWGASSANAVVSVSATGAITVTGGAWFRFEVFWFI